MFNRHPVAVSCLLLVALCFVLSSCSNGKNNNEPDTSSVKFDQYYLQGQALYINHCSNCHQKNGTGLGRVYPPLDKSDFMNEHFEQAICLMRYGKTGEIIVNGTNYVQGMPGIPSLTDLEIAEIATYIFNTWDHKKGIIEVKDVSRILNSCMEK